ncbi:MAG: hypothetical protein ACI9HK_005362 [Pirellulaceae bacterium]|jgi:hypothetical protein
MIAADLRGTVRKHHDLLPLDYSPYFIESIAPDIAEFSSCDSLHSRIPLTMSALTLAQSAISLRRAKFPRESCHNKMMKHAMYWRRNIEYTKYQSILPSERLLAT